MKANPTIAIVGGGFAGIGLAIALNRAGLTNYTIYERGPEPGGVWRDNHYPGCACDIPSRFYSYSFESDWPWREPYGRQGEILAYLRHCIAKYGVAGKIKCGVDVLSAAFDDQAKTWRLTTQSGETIEADVFVSAVGVFNNPVVPDIAGKDRFKGPQFHSAKWDHGIALAGRNVAVIGTGASAVQFVPAIAPQAAKLHLFQRTPQYVLPRIIPDTDPEGASALARKLKRLKVFLAFEKGTRRRGSDRLTAKAQDAFLKYLAAQVPDPALRAKLTPSYRLGCKRVLQSNDWYPALQRPNVEVIDTAIAEIVPEGVRCADGAIRTVDVIVWGTGFTPTEFLTPMKINGRRGLALEEAWRDGAEAYLGISVAGFPNFFMMYGPNTNGPTSIIYMLENQARYIVSAIRRLRRGRTMDVRPDVQRRFNDDIQRRLNAGVQTDADCFSYFRTSSGKVTTNWPGWLLEYKWRTLRVRRRDYEFA